MAETVLVTGAGGFIGGHLASALVQAGALVTAFVRYNSRGDRGSLDWHEPEVVREMKIVYGDLRDAESVSRAVASADAVFHLGAQIAIPYSYVNARDFFETNVLGSLNVAEAALAAGVRRVVHVSTSEVYGSAQMVPMTEAHPLEAQSPYSASKIGADKLMESFFRSHALPVTIVRPFNTYGPHQSARAVVPTVITQALRGGPLQLGGLEYRRDLTFVSDTVRGFMAAARSEAAIGKTVHLGTGQDASVAEIVAHVSDLIGRPLEVQLDPARIRPELSEVRQLLSDPGMARALIGWNPMVDLRAGLSETIAWIAANLERYRVGEYAV